MRPLLTFALLLAVSLVPACGAPPLNEELAAEVQLAPPASPQVQSLAASTHYLRNGDGVLKNAAGQRVELHGVNWFGFETKNTSVDGLWQGPSSASMDMATVVRRIKALGFNAVRLPMSFSAWNLPAINQARGCQVMSESALRHGLVPSGAAMPAVLPPLSSPAPALNGMCSAYLPSNSTFDRLVYTAQFFAKNGFYVVLDNHINTDDTLLRDRRVWLSSWQRLLKAVTVDPQVAPRIIVDVLNEPDAAGLRWEAQGTKPGMTEVYLGAMDALHKISPQTLFLVEGTGQTNIAMCWGDGFFTDQAVLRASGSSDPNPFLRQLLTKPYVDRVAISPHVYPPSISKNQRDLNGPALFKRMTASYGLLGKKGYCVGAKCKRFPIVVGEIGSAMTEAQDISTLKDMALWMRNTGVGNDGQHNAVSGFFWWAWNANSGDTGGIVENDWQTINWKKVNYLRTLGLRPWYIR